MRLKNINIEERSSIYSAEQKDRLRTISAEVNRIGEIFDVIVDLEMFIIENIETSLNNFMTIRANKDLIIQKEGEAAYLAKYFKIAADNLDNEINKAVQKWDDQMTKNGQTQYTLENIKKTIEKFKALYKFIDPITAETQIEGFEALKNIINEFTNFRVYMILTTDDIVDKLQSLIDLKGKIEGKKENKKITIEDL